VGVCSHLSSNLPSGSIEDSQVARAVCINAYGGGPHGLWLDSLIGMGKDISNEPAIQHGVLYEPHVRKLTAQVFKLWFAEAFGMFVFQPSPNYEADHWRKLAATPDGVCGDEILEIKAPYSKHTTRYDIPLAHYVQIQVNMLCTGSFFANYVVFVIDNDLELIRLRKYAYDAEFVTELLGWLEPMLIAWGDPTKAELAPKRCSQRKARTEKAEKLMQKPVTDSGEIIVPSKLRHPLTLQGGPHG